MKSYFRHALISLIALLTVRSSGAAFTWTKLSGGNASGNWTNQADWSGGTLPTTNTDSANFTNLDLTTDSTITLDGSQTINVLNFGDAGLGSAANWILNSGIPSTATLTFGGTSPAINVTNLASGEAVIINAPITGTNGFTKTGSSFLQLAASNSYSGTTILNSSDCRFSFANDHAFGSGKVQVGVLSGGTGSGEAWFQAAGDRNLTNAFEIQTIRWIIDGNPAAGIAAGSLTLNGPVLLNQGGSNVRDVYCNQNLIVNGAFTSTGALNKNGSSTLTLNGTNNFTGGINILGGTLVVNGQVSNVATTAVVAGTVLTGTGSIAGSVALGGTLQAGNFGSLTSNIGTLVLSNSANLVFNLGANTNLTNGFIKVNGNLALGGNLQITDLGGFAAGNYTNLYYSGTLTNGTLTPTVVPQGKSIFVRTDTPHYIVFQVLNGTLFPTAGLTVPMDLASPLTLSWIQGPNAVAYDEYLGTISNSVFLATTNTTGIYQGRTTGLTNAIGPLSPNTTYYWRIDSVAANGAITIGPVMSFTTGAPMVDEMEDTWVATDALGRSLPGNADCGDVRTNRPIGLFYFLWHDTLSYGSGTNWDNSLWITNHPFADPHNPWASNPIFQQVMSTYWWGQPQLGYYHPADPWVLRRQIALLQHAGVDVLIFDYSNGVTYDSEMTALCNMIRQMRSEGYVINLKIVFLTHSSSAATATYLYNTFYSQNKFSDLWFYWQGKPLMLGYVNGDPSVPGDPAPAAAVQNFFTWRTSWANVSSLYDEWQWIDSTTPQNWGYDLRSDLPEEASVTCGGWATSNIGRSGTNRTEPAYDGYHLPVARTQAQGLYFAEQMNYGLKYDPQFLFITGWNEWVAGSFPSTISGFPSLLGNVCPLGGYYFVDEYDEEFSRDIEPMKGGHTDNYYFQMAGQNRLRKGARPAPFASAPQTINLSGGAAQWTNVGPAYYDPVNDTIPRNYASSVSQNGSYTNTTGRNDFTVLKVARDATNLYFYAQCHSNLTSAGGSNWMVLFLDMDQNHATGWEGYDYAVNLGGVGAGTTALFQNSTTTNGWNWVTVRNDIAYTVTSNVLMLAVPRASLGLGADPVNFDFHWADDFQTNDIADFGINGDSAPDRRFNYRYQTQTTMAETNLVDDFESGGQPVWGASFNSGSCWAIATTTAYSGNHSAECNISHGTGNKVLQTGFDAGAQSSFRVTFRYKLNSITSATGVNLSYLGTNGWVVIRNLGRDQYYPSGQAWSYDEQQNVWLYFTDVRYNTGTNGQFFNSGFNLRIDGTSLASTGQSVWVDDFQVTGIEAGASNVVVKANNADPLWFGTSWVGGLPPASNSIARWDATVTGANTTSLGTDSAWSGLKIINPGGPVVINGTNLLTLGTNGIDLSAASQNLSLGCNVNLAATQSWNVAGGLSLSVDGAVRGFGDLNKNGGGTLVLNGADFSTGNLNVLAGVVNMNQGPVSGAVNVQAGGTLKSGNAFETLALGQSLTLAGTLVMKIGKTGSFTTNDEIIAAGALNCGGTLVVSNVSGAFTTNDNFKLFAASNYSGNFGNKSLPTLGAGMFWDTSGLTASGVLAVRAVPNLGTTLAGNIFQISWPTNYSGWQLQAQTNSTGRGLGTNWVNLPINSSNIYNFTVNPASGSVFFRLLFTP